MQPFNNKIQMEIILKCSFFPYSIQSFNQTEQNDKKCLSPISMIQIFNPEAFNGTVKQNPIYRSSLATEFESTPKQTENAENGDELTMSNIQITPAQFMHMCPALLLQIEQGSCTKSDPTEHDEHEDHNDHDGHDHGEYSEPFVTKTEGISTYGKKISELASHFCNFKHLKFLIRLLDNF